MIQILWSMWLGLVLVVFAKAGAIGTILWKLFLASKLDFLAGNNYSTRTDVCDSRYVWMDGWTLSCVATRASRSPPIKGRTNQRPWSVSHSGRHSVIQWAVTAAIVVCRRRSDTRIVVGWFFSNLPPFKQKPRNQQKKRKKKSNQKVLHLNGRPKRFVIFCRHFTHILVNYHG